MKKIVLIAAAAGLMSISKSQAQENTMTDDDTFTSQAKRIETGVYVMTLRGKPIKGPLTDIGWLTRYQRVNETSTRSTEFLMSDMVNAEGAQAHADVQEWNEYRIFVEVAATGSYTLRPFQRPGSPAHLVSMHANLRPATKAELATRPQTIRL